ncbi:MAG: SDR family oxidoreductase [Patescibacteria group bacterium]|nr:SDR family oxidoreductase [Patescibacteria group bacterium]MCL5224333.1 SDR family oxidoreductase [Patescibacteria group bacterium]
MIDKLRIMVGGGAGYIGSILVPELLRLGHKVTVVDLLWFGNHLPSDTKIIQKDLFHLEKSDLTNIDIFIFLAGLSNDPMAEFSPAKNFIYNAALPAYLAFIAKQAGVKRYIYASSCSVYGYTDNSLYDETAPTISSYPYGISKLQGEKGVFQLQDKDFSVIALRQGTVGGYSPRMRFDLIVNTMFKTAIKDGKITINNPAIWRPLCDVRDTAAAYVKAIQLDSQTSDVFNIALSNFTVGEIGEAIKKKIEELTKKSVLIDVKNVQDYRNYKVSTDKAATKLGFKASFSIADTIEELFRHIDQYQDFEKDEFYNIRTFKKIEGGGERQYI